MDARKKTVRQQGLLDWDREACPATTPAAEVERLTLQLAQLLLCVAMEPAHESEVSDEKQ